MILNFGANINSAMGDGKDTTSNIRNGAVTNNFANRYWGFQGTGANASNPFYLDFAETNHIGVCCYVRPDRIDLVNDGVQFLEIIGDNNAELITMRGVNGGQIELLDKTSGSTVIAPTIGGVSSNAWSRIDLNFKLAVDGYLFCQLDGVVLMDFTGDTTGNGAATNLKQVNFQGGNATQGLVTPAWDFMNAIVTDGEDTLGLEAFQHTIQGDGRFTEMEGSYLDVDNLNIDNSSQIVARLLNTTQSITIDEIPATLNGYYPVAMGVSVRTITKNDVELHPILDDGVNVSQGVGRSTDNIYGAVKAIFSTAPDGSGWTTAKISSIDVGMKVEAKAGV